jgi:hypothetical protein
MAQTIEERLTQLEKAHSRLFNQYQNLLKDFEKFKSISTSMVNDDYTKIKNLEERIEQLKDNQPVEQFINGNRYRDVIEEIVTNKKVDWENKIFSQLEVKLRKRPELYKIFVLEKNTPKVNDRITFIYDAEDKKLTKLKCI